MSQPQHISIHIGHIVCSLMILDVNISVNCWYLKRKPVKLISTPSWCCTRNVSKESLRLGISWRNLGKKHARSLQCRNPQASSRAHKIHERQRWCARRMDLQGKLCCQMDPNRSAQIRLPKDTKDVFQGVQAVKEVCIVCCGQWQTKRLLRLQWVGEQCQQRIEKSCDRNHAAWWVSLAARDPPYF